MTRFRQALLDELQSRVTADLPPAYRSVRLTRPRLAFGGGALAAAVAVAAVVVTQGGGAPAYAVTTEPDGTVSVTVNRLDDPAAANQQLRATGNRVMIMLPSPEQDCPAADRGTRLPLRLRDAVALIHSKKPYKIRVRPDYIPADAVLVLMPVKGPARGVEKGKTEIMLSWYAAPGPTCVTYPS